MIKPHECGATYAVSNVPKNHSILAYGRVHIADPAANGLTAPAKVWYSATADKMKLITRAAFIKTIGPYTVAERIRGSFDGGYTAKTRTSKVKSTRSGQRNSTTEQEVLNAAVPTACPKMIET